MTVDYDLIILGGAAVGRYAAVRASQLGARVALIEPPSQPSLASQLLCQTLTQLNGTLRQQSWLQQWGYAADDQPDSAALDWRKAQQWAKTLAETIEISSTTDSLSRLAIQGVEVISEAGAFYRHPRLGFSTAGRTFRSRRYLLTPASSATVPEIDGITTVAWATFDSLAAQWQTLPKHLFILGRDPRGIALAQGLNRLGTQVTLVTTANRLLPAEDEDTALILQAQLEAEGVTVLTRTEITQIKQIDDQIWVQVGNQAVETEAILLATKPQLDLASLNLEAASVKWQPNQITVNRRLQTTHPRIYACGEGLGGYFNAAVDRYEAEIALQNALFLPLKSVDYRCSPTAIFTDPPLVRIGRTEAQAQAIYGADVRVVKQSFNCLTKSQIYGDTGFCKLIALKSGEILGAHCIGTAASEWIGSIALAMQHSIKLPTLAQSPHLSPTIAEVIQQAAQSWQQQRPDWQQELLETWFNFTRSR